MNHTRFGKRSVPSHLKRGIVTTLAAMMVLTACGGDASEDTDSTDATADAGDDGEDGAASGDVEPYTLVIGGHGPLTGPVSGFGIQQQRGAELAVEDINASGELEGWTLELLYEDDVCDAAQGQAVYRRLVDQQQADMLFGGACSPGGLAVAELAEEDQIPYVNATAVATGIADPPRRYVFSTNVDAAAESEALLELVMTEFDPASVGFMFTANDYGQSSVDSAKMIFERDYPEVEFAAEAGFPQGTSDFSGGLLSIREANPDAVFVVGAGGDIGPMVRQARDLGIQSEIFGFSSLLTIESMRTAGDLLDGTVAFFYTPSRPTTDSDDPFMADLVTRYRDTFDEWPDGISFQGYQGIVVVAEA